MNRIVRAGILIGVFMALLGVQVGDLVLAEETPLYDIERLADGTASIIGYHGSWDTEYTVVQIPDEIDGYAVSAIGDCAFLRAFFVEEIRIPEGVKSIGRSAFQETDIRRLILPSTIQEIGEGAFFHCGDLMTVIVPPSVTVIGERAFGYAWYADEDPFVVPGVTKVIPEFIMVGEETSVAETYAQEEGVAFRSLRSFAAGDVDMNDACNITDAFTVYKGAAGEVPLQWYQQGLADMDANGRVDTADAFRLFTIVSGKAG